MHLWILFIAFVTIALPAAYQQLQSAFPLSIRTLKKRPHSRRNAPRHARPHHGAAAAHQRDRDLVLHIHRRSSASCRQPFMLFTSTPR